MYPEPIPRVTQRRGAGLAWLGYEASNVRLALTDINMALGDFGGSYEYDVCRSTVEKQANEISAPCSFRGLEAGTSGLTVDWYYCMYYQSEMIMAITVKLDRDLEEKLRERLAVANTTLSDYVRNALIEKMERESDNPSPYDLWQKHFSGWASGETDRSERVSEIVGDILRAKHRAR